MNKNLTFGLLACSVILNAFLAGYVFSSHGRQFLPPRSPMHRMDAAIKHLDPLYQDKISKIVRENHMAIDGQMREMNETFRDVHAILSAPKFDPAQLQKLHRKLFTYDDNIKKSMLNMLIEIGQSLPDGERIRFFNEIKPDDGPGLMGGPPHGHGPDGPPPEDE